MAADQDEDTAAYHLECVAIDLSERLGALPPESAQAALATLIAFYAMRAAGVVGGTWDDARRAAADVASVADRTLSLAELQMPNSLPRYEIFN